MTDSSYRMGWLAAAALVLLRVGIGVHFFAEGADKLADPKPFSGPFFGNAKGPLAGFYKGLVWDADGLHRLSFETAQADWDAFRHRIVSHYGFDEKQAKQASDVQKDYTDRLKTFLAQNADKVEEYYLRLERRDKNAADRSRQLSSLQTHDSKIQAELMKLRGELLPTIDNLWKDYETAMNALATDEQWQRHGRLALAKPGRGTLDSVAMDSIVPWFDLAIGVCLILGLFTRVAAIAGAAFLASVCLSQWPGSPGAIPIYNQFVEMLALLALAAVGAGRYLGLDYFLGGLMALRSPPKKQGAAQ